MRILNWNVNGIRACVEKGLPKILKEIKPDVFCVQETKSFREQCKDMWEPVTGMKEFWNSASRPGYSGTANFFNNYPNKVEAGCGVEDFDREGRWIISDYGSFYLINSYFPNGASSDERHLFKMKYLDYVLSHLKKLNKKKPLILTGDINIAHREIDIHDPVRLNGTSGFKPEERAWMDELFKSGFVDAYRYLYPDARDQYTWWSYRAGARQRNKGWRIDYFIVSDGLANSITKLELLQDIKGSDHCPLLLEISQ